MGFRYGLWTCTVKASTSSDPLSPHCHCWPPFSALHPKLPFLVLLSFMTATCAGFSSSIHSLNVTVCPKSLISDLLFSQPILSPGWCHSLARFKNLLHVDRWLPSLHPKSWLPLEIQKYIATLDIPTLKSYWSSKPSTYKSKPLFLPLWSLPALVTLPSPTCH